MSNFYGTEIEIWVGFGPVGNTEKKFGPIMSNFCHSDSDWGFYRRNSEMTKFLLNLNHCVLRAVFSFTLGQNFLKIL